MQCLEIKVASFELHVPPTRKLFEECIGRECGGREHRFTIVIM